MSDQPENPTLDDLTLHDWFAGMALQGILAHRSFMPSPSDAKTAFDLADAMMAERARRKP